MKLFKLESRQFAGYDRYQGFVLRAENEEDARKLAEKYADYFLKNFWTSIDKTTCEEIAIEGKAEVILSDYAAG